MAIMVYFAGISQISPVLVCCTKNNLATLLLTRKEFEMLCPQQAGLGCRKKMRNGLARQFHALKLTLSLQRQKFSVQAIFKNCRRL
jgi:hypothetical protein